MIHCTRCRPNRPCLSHSFLPFGQCWLDIDDPLLRKYPKRRVRNAEGKCVRDSAGRYFFDLKGISFDEAPLGYLDWLAGQDWLRPGVFKQRLTAYLTHGGATVTRTRTEIVNGNQQHTISWEARIVGPIEKELDDLFPDPDDDSRQPAFTTQLHDRWHGQPMPELESPEPPTRWSITTAWEALADFLADADNAFHSETYYIEQFLEAASHLKSAIAFLTSKDLLGAKQLLLLRAKYRAWRQACRRSRYHHPGSPYFTPEQRLQSLLSNSFTFAED